MKKLNTLKKNSIAIDDSTDIINSAKLTNFLYRKFEK